MSDGEAFEPIEDVVTEAKRAGEEGVSLVTVGFGSPRGAVIPIKASDGSMTTKKDETGNTVVTLYHPEYLKAAADAAGGSFIDASETDKAARVKSALATLRTQARASLSGEMKTPRYQWFLFPALFLLLLDTMMLERRGRRRVTTMPAAASAAASLVLALLLNGCIGMTRQQQAVVSYEQSQFGQAASLFRDAINAGDKRPETMYNLGTALVAGDSVESAAEVLNRLVDEKNDEIRYRSLFNLGLAHLKPGLASPSGQDGGELDSALAVYKQALLMRPADLDAKWNYELALRKKKQGGGGGGGGGGGANKSPKGQTPQPQGGLGQSQAEQLLGSAAREERDVQSKKQKQNKVEPPPGGKDW
jgi:Ca-activated chloride channel family protein